MIRSGHPFGPLGKRLDRMQEETGKADPLGYLVPMVVERDNRSERAYDIFSRLLQERIVFVGPEINDYAANLTAAQILYLYHEDDDKEIHMYINTPGGILTAGLAIYDTMQYVSCDVCTYCIGQAASMGAVLLAAGTRGKRNALPHSRIMIHQPWGGASGQAEDIVIQAKEIRRNKELLLEALQRHTGQSREVLERDTDRDFYMTPEEALSYGIIDEVLVSARERR